MNDQLSTAEQTYLNALEYFKTGVPYIGTIDFENDEEARTILDDGQLLGLIELLHASINECEANSPIIDYIASKVRLEMTRHKNRHEKDFSPYGDEKDFMPYGA